MCLARARENPDRKLFGVKTNDAPGATGILPVRSDGCVTTWARPQADFWQEPESGINVVTASACCQKVLLPVSSQSGSGLSTGRMPVPPAGSVQEFYTLVHYLLLRVGSRGDCQSDRRGAERSDRAMK
jgi:hypothetical protein